MDYYKAFLALRAAAETCRSASTILSFTSGQTGGVKDAGAIWVTAYEKRMISEIREAVAMFGFALIEMRHPGTEPDCNANDVSTADGSPQNVPSGRAA